MKPLPVILMLVAGALFLSCEKDTEPSVDVNAELYKLMQDVYYWNDRMPDVLPNRYGSLPELMEALRVNPPDHWSYVTTKSQYEAYFSRGTYVGFGFGSGFDSNGKLWVTFVFRDSPFASKGISRGWQIVTINGETPTPDSYERLMGKSESGVSATFEFLSPKGETITYTFAKTDIDLNSVLLDSVYTFGGSKVGYFVLKSFIEKTQTELTNLFARFKSEGITDLVVDLRYNGGGMVGVSRYLAELIGGDITGGKVFCTFYHNDNNRDKDSDLLFESNDLSLSLDRVCFITTSSTASASELVINSLKPFISVKLVGSSTHGKPVGMYSYAFKDPSIDWVIVPVCFTLRNANGEGDYYDGIGVDRDAPDDITRPFGDIEEQSLNTALASLGFLPGSSVKRGGSVHAVVGSGLAADIGAW